MKENGVFLGTERDRSDLGSSPGTDVCEQPQMQGAQMWIFILKQWKVFEGLREWHSTV